LIKADEKGFSWFLKELGRRTRGLEVPQNGLAEMFPNVPENGIEKRARTGRTSVKVEKTSTPSLTDGR
jgi:hypothetical protein